MRSKALALKIGLIALLSLRPLDAAESIRYIVFPLENLTRSSALAWLCEGLADSISDQLSAPGVEALDRETRARFIENWDLPPNATLSQASMILVAQKAGVDRIVIGSFSGRTNNIRIALRELNINTLKLGGEMVANGSLVSLPEMENELAWLILANGGLTKSLTREGFKERMRSVSNAAYSQYIRALGVVDEEERAKLLLQAVALHPRFPEAQFMLGRHYYRNGNCAQSMRYLDPSRERARTYLQAEFMLGTCRLRQNAIPEAIQSYSHILAFTRSIEVLNNLGVAYLRSGDLSVATQHIVEARTLGKSNPTVLLNLAIIRHLQKNESAAQDLVEDGLRLHPNNGMFHFLLGVVCDALGKEQDSRAALVAAQKLGIDAEKVRNEDPKTWARVISVWDPYP